MNSRSGKVPFKYGLNRSFTEWREPFSWNWMPHYGMCIWPMTSEKPLQASLKSRGEDQLKHTLWYVNYALGGNRKIQVWKLTNRKPSKEPIAAIIGSWPCVEKGENSRRDIWEETSCLRKRAALRTEQCGKSLTKPCPGLGGQGGVPACLLPLSISESSKMQNGAGAIKTEQILLADRIVQILHDGEKHTRTALSKSSTLKTSRNFPSSQLEILCNQSSVLIFKILKFHTQ